MAHPHWPFFDLRLHTPRLVLRPPVDDDFPALLALVDRGIHDPSVMPFAVPWTDAPSPEREWNAQRFWWRCRAELSPEHWNLTFMVSRDGAPIGMQDLTTDSFPVNRVVGTGSWLGREFQGQGYGKEMRAAVLVLAFEGLGAEVAVSEAFVGNEASVGVSRALGYEENGVGRHAPRGEPVDALRWRLTRDRFEQHRARGRYPDVRVTGLEACLPLLGLVA